MKITNTEKMAIGGIILGLLLLGNGIYTISKYLDSGKLTDDVTQAGVSIKNIIKDIKEAE